MLRDRSAQEESNAASDAQANRVHQSIFLLGARFPANTAETGIQVASVKRKRSGSRPWLVPPVGGRFTATNVTLRLLIRNGWPLEISGGPSWVNTDGYDVSAIAPEPDVNPEDFSLMMQNLLKDRFGLRVHTETHEARVYVLLPAKTGLKLPDAKPERMFPWPETSGCRSTNWMRWDGGNVRVDQQ